MPRSATPATQNDMTTCLETFKKRCFAACPIDTVTQQENQRLETRYVDTEKISILYETSSNFYMFDMLLNRLECHKVPRLPRKTTWQPAWKPSKRRGFAASPIDTAKPQENQRLETRHMGAPQRAFRARRPPIFTLWNMPKRHVLQLPPWTRRNHHKTNDARRDRWKHQNEHFVRDFLQFSHFVASKSTFSYEFSLEHENLQPQNRCFVRGFRQFSAHRTKCHDCHGICTLSPLDAALPKCDLQKTRNTTRLKCCACHEKRRWTRRKCCACHEICHASSQNVAKVLHLPHKATFDTLQNVAECHEVPRLPRETKQPDVWNLQKWSLLQNFP